MRVLHSLLIALLLCGTLAACDAMRNAASEPPKERPDTGGGGGGY